MGKNFEAGNYDLIPHQVFPMNDIKAALELMKTGKHVGKVVLTNYTKTADGAFEPLPVVVEKPQNVRGVLGVNRRIRLYSPLTLLGLLTLSQSP